MFCYDPVEIKNIFSLLSGVCRRDSGCARIKQNCHGGSRRVFYYPDFGLVGA